MDSSKKLGRKKELCFEISAAVKTVQRQYISSNSRSAGNDGKRSDDTEKKALAVERLCVAVEAVFLHELKNSKCVLWRETRNLDPSTLPEPSFWMFIEPMVSDEIKTQLLALRNSESDVRKCRSWVRLMLAKSLMVNFLEDLQRHPGLVRFHYGDDALLRDAEQSGIVIQLLRGLAVLNLPYDYAGYKLDTWDHAVLMLAGIWEGPDSRPTSHEKTSPKSAASPSNSSPSVQRVSPPASDFSFEGEAIIGMAMDKYVKRKASKSNMSDSQLLSKEIAEHLNPTPKLTRRDGGSGSSVESNGSMFEADPPSGSYGAMLRSYARRTEPQIGGDTGAMGNETRGGEEVEGEEGAELRDERDSENFGIALSLNYEVISSDGSLVESQKSEPNQQQRLVMVEHLVKLVPEKGLDSQNYMCDGCKRNIGLIFGQPKLCKFNGQHYCYDCHRDDERIIPARVLFNWDFRPHKVCLASCEFLDSVERSPVLDVSEINRALYLYIPALEESLKLRQQCKHLKDYLSTCKEQEVLDQFRKRLKSSHIYENVHKYSIRDLIDVNSGVLSERLKKLVKFGSKHVKQCALCSQKGFICEVCHNPQVIYPFDLTETSQCEVCHSVYHKACHPVKGSCPKCLRLRKRANSVDLFT